MDLPILGYKFKRAHLRVRITKTPGNDTDVDITRFGTKKPPPPTDPIDDAPPPENSEPEVAGDSDSDDSEDEGSGTFMGVPCSYDAMKNKVQEKLKERVDEKVSGG